MFVQPKDTLKEIWEGDDPVSKEQLQIGLLIMHTQSRILRSILSKMMASSSRIMHRMGVNSDVDSLVVEAIKNGIEQGKG